MKLIIKQLEDMSHIYLFDDVMRPLSVDIAQNAEVNQIIAEKILVNDIRSLSYKNKIKFNKSKNYHKDNFFCF